MGNPLGVGLVGAGFANLFHAKAFVGVRNADVVAVCATKMEKAKKLSDQCGELGVGHPTSYADIEQMLRDPGIDALWIGVPNYARLQITKAICEEVRQGKTNIKGICFEKPLARNVKEGLEIVDLVEKADILHGYLENQVFMPSVSKGKEILWKRGATASGRPYLARAAEEHGGPHSPWFWQGTRQGGGVLSDMMCHSQEAARYMLTGPEEDKNALRPKTVDGEIACLKWTRPEYVEALKNRTNGNIDYSREPSEDFARATVSYESENGSLSMTETTTSWSFVGPGLRLSFELVGPEYYLQIDTLRPELQVFFSRQVAGIPGEDLIEKQTAEQGLMPVVADESFTYGYQSEDRHMVDSFIKGVLPEENMYDGLLVTKLLMSCYLSAETGKRLKFPPPDLDNYVPKVQQGLYDPKSVFDGF